MFRIPHLVTWAIAFSIGAPAQEMRFLFPAPPAGSVTIARDVTFASSGDTPLQMDVFRPAARPGAPKPALIVFNTAFGPQRNNAVAVGWAQTAASNGVVGIVPDLRMGRQVQDFDALVAHLVDRSADYGIDRDAIAVFAGSGNVTSAFPAVEDPGRTAVKAAVMYYGTADVPAFRLDLPVLLVRAGLDRPPVNRAITELAARAVAENAPVTLVNHPTGHHGFEVVDDDDGTREMIERTIDFVKRATSASYQAALRLNLAEAAAAGHMAAGNYRQAADAYATLAAARPDDARVSLAYGEALLADAQFAAACARFEQLKGRGLGARDLGLPAARACMQKGDPEAAMAWLKSIPARFLPPSVATEPVFAPLRDRPDFKALFPPR
jgi:dienelactone hydrolase